MNEISMFISYCSSEKSEMYHMWWLLLVATGRIFLFSSYFQKLKLFPPIVVIGNQKSQAISEK